MNKPGAGPSFLLLVGVTAAMAAAGPILRAQSSSTSGAAPGVPASAMPAALREVGFDQNLGGQVPLDLEFRDEDGRPVTLARYAGSRPVVLALVYYGCPMLCTQTLNSLASTIGVLSQEPGKDFEVVTVSFDPRETPELARAKKAAYITRAGKPRIASGWHFLTGDQRAISALTRSVGFRYVWDDSAQQFAHPTGLVVLTRDGRVARYLFGIEYGPRDLRLAIVDAAAGRVSSPIQRVLLYCYHYDLATGRYSLIVMRVVQLAGLATILCLATVILVFTATDRRRRRAAG
jgi:protein SCO1/2